MHTNDTEVSQKRYRYCGKEKDNESGLYYYGARYYADWLCRFTAVDPRAHSFPYQSSFVYAANNPITNTDFNGESALNPNDPDDPVEPTEPSNSVGGSDGTLLQTIPEGKIEYDLWYNSLNFIEQRELEYSKLNIDKGSIKQGGVGGTPQAQIYLYNSTHGLGQFVSPSYESWGKFIDGKELGFWDYAGMAGDVPITQVFKGIGKAASPLVKSIYNSGKKTFSKGTEFTGGLTKSDFAGYSTNGKPKVLRDNINPNHYTSNCAHCAVQTHRFFISEVFEVAKKVDNQSGLDDYEVDQLIESTFDIVKSFPSPSRLLTHTLSNKMLTRDSAIIIGTFKTPLQSGASKHAFNAVKEDGTWKYYDVQIGEELSLSQIANLFDYIRIYDAYFE